MIFKLKIYFFGLFLLYVRVLPAQDLLQQSDSLYSIGKYTEALELYEKQFEKGEASPAMLLRMSFINEGLNNHAEALFFLEKYFQITSNRKVLSKITEIADSQNFNGYTYSDFAMFRNVLYKYRNFIVWPGMLFLAFAIFYLLFTQRKKFSWPMVAFQILISLLLLLAINDVGISEKAIVKYDNVLLMSGPSAAAEPLFQIEKGHKVPVLYKGEIWSKIMWRGDEVYIRTNKLLEI